MHKIASSIPVILFHPNPFWTFAEQFASKGIGFIVHIVLARILLPEEFGLIAMIMVFIGIGHSLVDSGIR